MSAIRLNDYRTGEVTVVPFVTDLVVNPPGPVTRRFLTPEERALRDDTPPPMLPVRGILKEREVRPKRKQPQPVRRVLHSDHAIIEAVRACGGNLSAAADRLGTSATTMWRRSRELQRKGRWPADLVTGRAVMYSARRPRTITPEYRERMRAVGLAAAAMRKAEREARSA